MVRRFPSVPLAAPEYPPESEHKRITREPRLRRRSLVFPMNLGGGIRWATVGVEITNRHMHLAPRFSRSAAALLDGPVPTVADPGVTQNTGQGSIQFTRPGS
jgi:hypothetical protein